MPKLLETEVPNLYRNETTGIYYVRKYIAGKGEKCISTREKNITKAQRAMNQILLTWLGSKAQKASIPFEMIGDEKIALYKSGPEETYKNYERHYRLHLKPYFEGISIDEIGPLWQKYVSDQKTENPKRKLKHDRMVMSVILHYACEQGFLEAVPKLPIPKADRRAAPGREYSNTEIKKVLLKAGPNLRLHIEIQFKMGMRSGEVDKLKWEYIDFANGLIRLPPEVVKSRDKRVYPVDPGVLKKLWERKDNGSPYVFPMRGDKTRHKTRSDKQWQRVKHAVDFKGRKHWFRHTAATRFVKAGIPPAIVQKALGMSDRVMRDIYLHVDEEQTKKMASLISDSLKQEGRKA